MSVSIAWEPAKSSNKKRVEGGSLFADIIKRAFGEFPVVLDHNDVDILQGIAYCGHPGADELTEAISECDKIRIDARW